MSTHTINCSLILSDWAQFEHVASKDVWSLLVTNNDHGSRHSTTIGFDRAAATELHAWLSAELGLGWNGARPGVVEAPVTASKAHDPEHRPISPELASARLGEDRSWDVV